jgi:RimJ/RimL family protein N-acetyltransferase
LYAISNNNNLPIGIAGYLRINPEHGVIEVGHLHYSKLLQKTPAATEVMYLMMRYIFDDLGYRRYEWKCNSLNEASKNAALRLGFKFEGIFRQSNVFKKYNRDTAWFSIIDSEWIAIKERFHRWLDPNNFDAKGKQIISLSAL